MFKRLISAFILSVFFSTSVINPSLSYAQVLGLPEPGTMVNLSQPYAPALLRGLVISLHDPMKFDFIVDTGDARLGGEALAAESQRMVNYFLATLTTPQKDLWVNLSPVEKDRIIPDQLIKTELGRDLLAQDYILKQLTASLIYPESGLGKEFWQKIYDQANAKFGTTDIPVDVFNKVWIVPETASVFEKGNAVYITKAHLKVMLEADYLAQGNGNSSTEGEIAKQVLRDVIVPAIEKEVNEGKHFAQLRQIVYAMVLAQWYQDVLKESILNKAYSGQGKVAGIDLSDTKNKELIYAQYMSAYKKGVFNYIKEETDRLTHEPVAKKYFSGGFKEQKITRKPADPSTLDDAENNMRVSVRIDRAEAYEPVSVWNSLDRPKSMLVELKDLWKDGSLDHVRFLAFMEKYSMQVASQENYPVQGAWPVLKAVTLLEKDQEQELVKALEQIYGGKKRPALVDAILLMNNRYTKDWLKEQAPHLDGRMIYMMAAEIHHWAGGLGPVMKFHGKGMQDLGAQVSYLSLWYQLRRDKGNPSGDPLDYQDRDTGLTQFDNDFDAFEIDLGDKDGHTVHRLKVKVASAIDENGVRVYLMRDVQPDGTSFYTRMLYNYGGLNNPVTKEESMAFFNVASAQLLVRLEEKRKKEQGNFWKPAVVHSNDGQGAPLQAVTMSHYGENPVVKNIFWAFTTHTVFNRGSNGIDWGINVFLKHMMGIKNRFINAFRHGDYIDHTSGGVRLAAWAGAVSNKHRDDMAPKDPNSTLVAVTNGAVPEEMAAIFREEFNRLKEEKKIPMNADYERSTADQVAMTKLSSKKRLNEMNIRTANGGVVEVDLDKPLLGYSRRLVGEKAGRNRAFTDDNIWRLVELGYNVVLMGNNQGAASEMLAAGLKGLEKRIAAEKVRRPNDLPGKFQFVEAFTSQQKKVFLAAEDVQIQDSDNHTGAAEFSEEDITANAGYQAGAKYREGVIVDQGIPVDFEHPGEGNTLIPREDTPPSWIDSVYVPLIELWKKDEAHSAFYSNATLSPRLNRIQRYLITSADYLKEYDKVMAREETQAREDDEAVAQIVQSVGGDKETLDGLLVAGRDGVSNFEFRIFDVPEVFTAKNKGLRGFTAIKNGLEEEYGDDVFLQYYLNNNYQEFLEKLFDGLDAKEFVDQRIDRIKRSLDAKSEQGMHLEHFMERLEKALEIEQGKVLQESGRDKAERIVDGGIDARNIKVERRGRLAAEAVSNKALEDMLMSAPGMQGVIVGIKPIPDLFKLLGVVK